ncbi:dihydrolipoyllysine-residue succinyltransferase [Inquilinus sp.]|jgi:2-oxoglutarate dehydrogenase E2 component (dihydrolipoamide succinyltransferase)|uniref:dihydrolipoyllysine-residue succinyltransferase n=1 Tax=Inquilinus sp. TaxID=1932117 RepID=UPI003784164E
MATEVKVPVLPESVSDATIASWHKKAGEAVKRDENLVDLETDKVVLEVPSPVDGVLKEIKFQEGDTVTSSQILAVIEEGAAAEAAPAKPAEEEVKPAAKAETPKAAEAPKAAKVDAPKAAGDTASLPPGARFSAITEGVDPAQVDGTGRRGAVTKEDIVNFAKSGGVGKASGARPEERVAMTRVRKTIAKRLMESKNSTAMLTTFNEVNLSKVSAARKELQDEFQKAHGIKLGFMSFFAKASCLALRDVPSANAYIEGDEIVYHDYVDISVAVSAPNGLVVPVVRDAHAKSFAQIELDIADFGARARDGTLTMEDMKGGTFTISNGGVFGSLMSTPIINPPQSAVLGLHRIDDRPVVVNGEIVIRPMMYIALSYDHRLIDGREAVTTLKIIKEAIEDPTRLLIDL